ncbi:MAG: hypothetical protein ACE5FN_08005 [Leptospirillia bacterium]
MNGTLSNIPGKPAGPLANERGMVLVICMWLMVFLAVVGASANVLSRTDIAISGNYKNDTEAMLIAEAGLQRALGEINTNVNWIFANPDLNDAFGADDAIGNGNYTVVVRENDPTAEAIRVTVTGSLTDSTASASVEAVLLPEPYSETEWASFACGSGDFGTKGGVTINGNVYAKNAIKMGTGAFGDMVVNGIVQSYTSVSMGGASGANGDILAGDGGISGGGSNFINGDATSSGSISGALNPVITGTRSQNEPTNPVTDECISDNMALGMVTIEDAANYEARAGATNVGTSMNLGDSLDGGVYYASGNLTVNDPIPITADTVLVVNGGLTFKSDAAAGLISTSTPQVYVIALGGAIVQGNAGTPVTTQIDGVLQVGAPAQDGSTVTGNNLKLANNNSHIIINGSLLVAGGNLLINSGGTAVFNYVPLNNSNLVKRYGIAQWRRVS